MTFRREQKVWFALGPCNPLKDAFNEKWKEKKKVRGSEIEPKQEGCQINRHEAAF